MTMKLFGRRNRPLRVAILGSGPAALFAAQAVYETGNVGAIYARGERSNLYGAQYLHQPIPGLDCGSPQDIQYILKGSVEDYRRKVYGDWDSTIQVSPEALSPNHQAWNIRAAYGEAWDRYNGLIQKVDISPNWLRNGVLEAFDLIVWSLPLQPFCQGGHGFQSQVVWAQGDAPELGNLCSVTVEPWTVVCNGDETPRWYRAANVFGHRTAEWPEHPRPPVKGIARVVKAIQTTCVCWSQWTLGTPVIRVGRYGTWTKGVLSHQGYTDTRAALLKMK